MARPVQCTLVASVFPQNDHLLFALYLISFQLTKMSAEPLLIDTPTDIKQCDNVVVRWKGGSAPYNVEILDTQSVLGVIGTTPKTTLIWNADIDTALGPFTIVLQDNDRTTVQTQPFNITAAPENCMGGGDGSPSASLSGTPTVSSALSTMTAAESDNATSSKPDAGVIMGIVLAIVAGILLIVLVGFFYLRWRRPAIIRRDLFEEEDKLEPATSRALHVSVPPAPYQASQAASRVNSKYQDDVFATSPSSYHDSRDDITLAESSSGVSGIKPYNPYPSSRGEKGKPTASSDWSVSGALDRVSAPAQGRSGREADAGVRVVVSENDVEMDILPPAYGDVPRGASLYVRSDEL